MDEVDLIVIGSGQGGVPLAVSWASQGRNVVLFERGRWGGSCLNYGCTPSKMILASAHVAGRARRAQDLGVYADVRVDFPAVMSRIRETTHAWSQGVKQRLDNAGVRIVAGEARFVSKRVVSDGNVEVSAPVVVIDTGMLPFVPPIPDLQGIPYRTYVDFWEMGELPPVTAIVGAGNVGVELGQALAQLGSKVHLIERSSRPVAREEADVSETLLVALREDGVSWHLDVSVERVRHSGNTFAIALDSGVELASDALILAAGQRPNTAALHADRSGIALDDRGCVEVDKHFRTTCDGVYAIGDVTGQPAFTHVSWEDYRRLQAILSGENGGERKQMDRVLGYAFFTDPQVGRAGMTVREAKDQGFNARAVTLPLEEVARATEVGRTRGFYRMVVDADTDRILGATLVGPQTAELIHVFIALMEAGSTWQTLEQSVHIHPTFAEGLPSLARKLKQR